VPANQGRICELQLRKRSALKAPASAWNSNRQVTITSPPFPCRVASLTLFQPVATTAANYRRKRSPCAYLNRTALEGPSPTNILKLTAGPRHSNAAPLNHWDVSLPRIEFVVDMALPPSSPRLPSPPPPAEIQITPNSPLMGPNATRQAAQIEQTAIDTNAKRRIHPGTKSADMAAGPPLVPLHEVSNPPFLTGSRPS
jgi:hypothetical protein